MNNSRLFISSPGQFQTLAFQPALRQPPAPGEVEVEVHAAGLNFKDVLIALGVLGPEAAAKPLGSEFAARVAAIGEGVSGWHIGDKVMGAGTACLAQYVTAPAKQVVAIPRGISMAEAAGLPAAYLTAHFAMECARLSAGESILIHAASGGVGLATVMLARAAGAEIYATAGSDEKRAYLASIGVRHVFDSRSLAFADQIPIVTGGRGVDVVVNSLSGEFVERSFSLLAPHGRFIELGVRDILENRALALGRCLPGASYIALGSGSAFPKTAERLRDLVARIEQGELPVLPYRAFPASNAAEAFEYMARAKHIGKVVLEVRTAKSARGVAAGNQNYILPLEGVEVFRRVLASGAAQLAISTIDLAPRLNASSAQTASPAAPRHEKSQPRPTLPNAYNAPGDSVEKNLAGHWQEFLGIEPIGVDDDFFDLGGDSLLAVQLLTRIRRDMKVDLPAHALAESPTIARLAARLVSPGPGQEKSLPSALVCLTAGSPTRRPLFLFHPVGGQVYIYRDLAACLNESQPIWGIQADAEAGPETLEALAAHYLSTVRALQPHGPYQLGGSSFGGTLAYEIAQQLLKAGEEIALLALIDSPAPVHSPETAHDEPQIIAYLLGQDQPDAETLAHIRTLAFEDQIKHFADSADGRLTLSAAEIRAFLKLWGANLKALKDYDPQPYSGEVIFFRAMEPDGLNRTDYHDGWRGLISNMELHEVPDTQIGINLKPEVNRIARVLAERLEPRRDS